MLLFLKKKTEFFSKGTPAPEPASVAPDFIPVYSHFNPHTLLTKNGELMQIIKIASNLGGLDYEIGDSLDASVRETIRQAIVEHVESDRIALWIHTIRKRKPIHWRTKFKETFAAYAHDRWRQKHHWKFQYYNEIYISFLHEGQSSSLFDKESLPHVLLLKHNRQYRNSYLDFVYEELNGTVEKVMEKIRTHYNAQRLSVVERMIDPAGAPSDKPIVYSEPMEFLGHLINLRPEPFALPEADVSVALNTTTRTFGFNAMESRNAAGRRRFASLLTLKQYREVPPDTSDRLLQAPMEFIISQSFRFIPAAGALKQYRDQKSIFDISGDEYCMHASGMEDMLESDVGNVTDFGEHQTSIMVMADDFKQIDGELAKVQAAFSDLGLVTIREDIRLEECFWAQLPGNFEFVRRGDFINTTRIGGFCRLNRFAGGMSNGNHWGDAVALLPTRVGSPYFFNFHKQDNGHTAIFDFNSFHDNAGSVLLNFLLSETRKTDGRLYVFDRDHSAQLLFDKLGGSYHHFPALSHKPGEKPLALNPFALPDAPRSRAFLLAWCSTLLTDAPSDAQKEILRSAIDQIYTAAPQSRQLATFVEIAAGMDATLAGAFSKWHSGGVFSGLLDATEEHLDLNRALHAFDMNPVVRRPECIVPVFSYLLNRLITAVDGKPTIIVLHEAQALLENAFFAPRLESLLEMLRQHNAMMIFTSSKPIDYSSAQSFASIRKLCATQLYIPDDLVHPYAPEAMGLSEADVKMLLKMERQKGDFLLKQGGESIALRADLKELDAVYAVFANDSKHISVAIQKMSGTEAS